MSDFSKQPMFGRQQFLDKVRERVQTTGMTAVLGRSQSGKTTLLRHLREDLKNHDGVLVGYSQSTGEPNLMLRSLKDLYTSWLANSSYIDQAKLLWKKNKDSIVQKAGGTAGRFLGNILGVQHQAVKPVSGLVAEWFDKLESMGNQLNTGDIKLPTLAHDVAKDLLELLRILSGKHPILILDALEQSNDVETEAKLLSAIVRHVRDWPPLHIVIAARCPEADEDELKATKCITDMNSASAAVEILDIPAVNLDEPPELDRLMIYLRDKIPCTRDIKPAKIVKLIDGYGGVIGRWLEVAGPLGKIPERSDDLEVLAHEAHSYRYRELESKLSQLVSDLSDELKFCIRVALLPEMTSDTDWEAYSEIVDRDIKDSAMTSLQMKGVFLSNAATPSFGHTLRHNVVQKYLSENASPLARKEACYLIDEFASRIHGVDRVAARYINALFVIAALPLSHELTSPHRGLAQCAVSVGLGGMPDSELILKAVPIAIDRNCVSTLVAMALVNAILIDKEADDIERMMILLQSLQRIAEKHINNTALQEAFARGLYNAGIRAKKANNLRFRDELLDDLTRIAKRHPENSDIQAHLAKALLNTLVNAEQERDLERCNQMLAALRELANCSAANSTVQLMYAQALVNTANDAKCANALNRRDELMDELRNLVGRYEQWPDMQKQLAMGLFNNAKDALEENDHSKRNELIDELFELERRSHDNPCVQRIFLKGLFKSIIDACDEGSSDLRNVTLKELRHLTEDRVVDPENLKMLAYGLQNTLNIMNKKSIFEVSDVLIVRLRDLAESYRREPFIQHQFETGLLNSLKRAKALKDLDRCRALTHELSRLSDRHHFD